MGQDQAYFAAPVPHEPPPKLHLAGLLAEVRAELARRDAAWKAPLAAPMPAGPPRPAVDWESVGRMLQQPEQSADVGVTLPELRRLPAPLRWLGRLVAQGIFLAARVVTGRQRRFNHETLHYLRHLHNITRHLDSAAREQAALLEQNLREQHLILRQHQAMLQERLAAVESHTRDLRLHDKQLGQVRAGVREHEGLLRQVQTELQLCQSRLQEQEVRLQRLEATFTASDGTRQGKAA